MFYSGGFVKAMKESGDVMKTIHEVRTDPRAAGLHYAQFPRHGACRRTAGHISQKVGHPLGSRRSSHRTICDGPVHLQRPMRTSGDSVALMACLCAQKKFAERDITVICYLNEEGWDAERDGGALRLFLGAAVRAAATSRRSYRGGGGWQARQRANRRIEQGLCSDA